MNSPTRFLCRAILRRVASRAGYAVDGNHLFSVPDFNRVLRGRFCASVIERPDLHPARMVSAALLLSLTYR